MKKTRLLLLAFVAFAFTNPPADVKLEYVFKVGDEYTWVQSTKQSIKQSIMGMDQNVQNDYDGEFKLKVAELTSTGAKIETQFTKLKNTMASPQGNTVMDSEGSPDKMEDKIFKSLMNKPFFIFMNKSGKVEKLENIENIWSGLKDLDLDEAAQAAMKQSLEQLMGESALKGSFEQAFVSYPDKKVKQGDTWKVQTSPPMNFPITVENTWTLAKMTGNVANLTADGVYTTNDKSQTITLPGGFKAKVDLNGKQAMKSTVDSKTGWPSKLDVISELKGKMVLLAGGQIPEDMDIPMEILSETSFSITKK